MSNILNEVSDFYESNTLRINKKYRWSKKDKLKWAFIRLLPSKIKSFIIAYSLFIIVHNLDNNFNTFHKFIHSVNLDLSERSYHFIHWLSKMMFTPNLIQAFKTNRVIHAIESAQGSRRSEEVIFNLFFQLCPKMLHYDCHMCMKTDMIVLFTIFKNKILS